MTVAVLGKAEIVHVIVKPTQTNFKEDVKGRVIKQKPVILEDVQVRPNFLQVHYIIAEMLICQKLRGNNQISV